MNGKPWAQRFGSSGSNLGNGITIVLEDAQEGAFKMILLSWRNRRNTMKWSKCNVLNF